MENYGKVNSFKKYTVVALFSFVCMQVALAQSAEPQAGPAPAMEQAQAVEKKSVVSDVSVVPRPFYHGSGLFALGGALGGMVAAGAWKDEPDRIAGFVKQENINIGEIVKTEFERQFEQSAQAKKVFEGKGPGSFTMRVLYGITSVPFSDYRPYLSVTLRFVDATGAEKWKRRDYVGGHGNAKSIPYPDFFKSAEDFTSEFEAAANELVTLLINDFSRQSNWPETESR
jgi:hypothetical protein